MKKNLSLLRPFNLELAKAGEPICWFDTDPLLFVGAGTRQIVVEHTKTNVTAPYSEWILRMAPLTWLEGKPVYKGDVLYWKPENKKITISSLLPNYKNWLVSDTECTYALGNLTWEAPAPPAPKVETKEYWYRVAAIEDAIGTVYTITSDSDFNSPTYTESYIQNRPDFIRWITPRIYYKA